MWMICGAAEAALQAYVIGELEKQREAQRVNRPESHGVGLVPQRLLEPHRDLFSGTIGERDGADAMRIDAGVDEMLNARDQAEGLAGTRPRDDEHGAHRSVNGKALIGKRSKGGHRT